MGWPCGSSTRKPWAVMWPMRVTGVALVWAAACTASRIAPGTSGTLWAWAAFVALQPWLGDAGWAWLIGGGTLVGWWASTVTARHLGVSDPGNIVWDEIVAFWLVLWLVMPAPWWMLGAAFVLFRFFDAAKPGPVAWADALFKAAPGEPIGWAQGVGILFDDLVAAGCTLLVLALAVKAWPVAQAVWG